MVATFIPAAIGAGTASARLLGNNRRRGRRSGHCGYEDEDQAEMAFHSDLNRLLAAGFRPLVIRLLFLLYLNRVTPGLCGE
jgi:hypothetical protein